MPSKKLVDALSSLDSKELKRFGQFVRSPFFNRNPRLITFMELLERAAPTFEGSELEKKNIFIAMYGPDVPYQEQQVYDHISFLMRLLDNFFAQLRYEADEVAQKSYLLEALTDRNLDQHFARNYKKSLNQLKKASTQDRTHFRDRYRLAQSGNHFYARQMKREFDDSLSATVENLDIFYLATKLKYTCDMLNRANIIQAAYRSEMIEQIQTYLLDGDSPYQNIPAINLYSQIYRMLTDIDNEAHYERLVELLDKYSHLFEQEEANELYSYAQNYCTQKINSGNPRYMKEIFRLYKMLLEKGLLMVNNILDHRIYKNIVTVGLRLKEYDWVEDFMNQYREMLSPGFKEASYHFNLGALHYERKNYREALKTLQRVEIDDVYFNLSNRAMLLKIYYEMEEEDALDSLIRTFGIYLKRNRYISDYHYTIHQNLLRYVKKLDRLRNKSFILGKSDLTKEVDKLKSEINETRQIANINWLLGKVDEVLKNK